MLRSHVLHICWIRLWQVNPLNAALNPIRHLLALVGARSVVHVSRVRVNVAALKSWEQCLSVRQTSPLRFAPEP